MTYNHVQNLLNQGKLLEAEQNAQLQFKSQPNAAETMLSLAHVYLAKGQVTAAAQLAKKALHADQTHRMLALELLFECLSQLEQFEQALKVAKQLAELDTSNAGYFKWVADTLRSLYRDHQAIEYFQKSLQLDDSNAEVYQSLAMSLSFIGRAEDAFAHLGQAIERNPSNVVSHYQRAYHSNYLVFKDEAQVREVHAKAAQFSTGAIKPFKLKTRKQGKPRIGFVSGDMREHSVAYFLLPILSHWNGQKAELFLYNDWPQSDAMSETFRRLDAHWIDSHRLDDKALFKQIREDHIDILVDLIAYSRGPRLGVFARRAAPVQVTYLAYPNTTGLSSMDYRIVDDYTDPKGLADHLATEKLVRLPHSFLCYRPSQYSPEIAPLPALNNGHITFGSFNKMPKITEAMRRTWCRLLNELSDSKLYIKSSAFMDPSFSEHLISAFESAGIEKDRLIFKSYSESTKAHLEEYAKIDIHLDTFPYNGTTTTCEALWQGVPSVTLCGTAHRSRVSADILNQIGLEAECVAHSESEYVDQAIALGTNIESLSALRHSMRDKMRSSPLMQEELFSQTFQETLVSLNPI